MRRASAAGAALLMGSACLLAQSPGAPNHSNGNTTRTQTIHVGEPSTRHPGGNPGRTTGKTGNQSPFGPPAPYGPPTPPPGPCDSTPPSRPTKILSFPVTNTSGKAAIGALTVAGDADQTGILCLLETISQSPSGSALINAIVREGQQRGMTVDIIKPDAGAPGPGTRPGGGREWDWLKAQPAALSTVYKDQPTRPKLSNGNPDFSADGIVPDPINSLIVWGAGKAGIRGAGVGSTIRFAPSMFPLNALGIQQSSNAGADVGLIHELIHGLRHMTGVANRTPIFKIGDPTKADATWLTCDERDTIGDSSTPAGFITENSYRKEMGIVPRTCVSPTCF